MDNGLFEDYGEAIMYVMLVAAVLGMMTVVLEAFTAFQEGWQKMDEIVSQQGELMISIVAALAVIGAVMLLLGLSDAGILRTYLEYLLEAAC